MKKFYISFLFITFGFFLNAFAQESSCYDQYRKVFENRGANPVEDGAHDNIILTIRTEGKADCYVARAVVQNSVIVEIDMYFEDGTFEKKEFEFKDKSSWSIHNGMSKTKITEKDEYVNIMFVNKIKPKRKKLMKAPTPDFDLN